MTTLHIILEQTVLYLPALIGGYIVIALMRIPDLSIESSFVCGAIMGTQALVLCAPHVPSCCLLPIILLASAFGGALVGTISSVLTQKARFPHLLSSIITIGLFHGINQLLLGSSNRTLSNLPNPLLITALSIYSEIIVVTGVALALFVAVMYLLRTQLGYCLSIYGENPDFFKAHKLSTAYIFINGVVLANSLVGIGGYLCAQSHGFVDHSMGLGMPLLVITALLLGKALYKTKSLLITILGCSAYFVLQQLLLKVGFNLKYFTCVQAILILSILVLQYRKQHTPVNHLGI